MLTSPYEAKHGWEQKSTDREKESRIQVETEREREREHAQYGPPIPSTAARGDSDL